MAESDARPFRFYDNRQKYLTFVTTCDEKWRIAENAASMLHRVNPQPPAFRLFDAGVGDGTVLSHLLRAMHQEYPTTPFYVVGKEISLEDVRLLLEKLPDRFVEHPQMVVTITNLHYAEAPWLRPNSPERQAEMRFDEVALKGSGSHGFGEQLRALDPLLSERWSVKSSENSGNPLYVHPSALVLYREDHQFALDAILPDPAAPVAEFDFVLASQPWRSRTKADFKAKYILEPLSRSLRSYGLMLVIQARGGDPGAEIVDRIWPGEEPFPVGRHELAAELRHRLGDDASQFDVAVMPDAASKLTYSMHTLPNEIGASIGTSTLFAAWNAAIYVAQIEDERVEAAVMDHSYLEATADVLREYGGLWFNDETFTVQRL